MGIKGEYMASDAKTNALQRLNYIDGHLSGIRKMLVEDKYCVDILKQTFAVRRAIEKMEGILLEGHLQTCAVEGLLLFRGDFDSLSYSIRLSPPSIE